MGFWDKLFGMGKNVDPIPRRPLRLQLTPAPQNMPALASQYVDVVRNNDRFQLDYSPATVEFVDRFLQRFSDAGITNNDFAETIFVAGAYLGQIMVLHRQAQWVSTRQMDAVMRQKLMPVVLQLPDGSITDPITQVFRRYSMGKKESLQEYFQQMPG